MKSVSSRPLFLFAVLAAAAVFVAFFVVLNTSHVDREIVPAKQVLEDIKGKKPQSLPKRTQDLKKNAQVGMTRSQRAPAIAGSFATSKYLDLRAEEDDNPDDAVDETPIQLPSTAAIAYLPSLTAKPTLAITSSPSTTIVTQGDLIADDYYITDDAVEQESTSNSSSLSVDDAALYYGTNDILAVTNESSTQSPRSQGMMNQPQELDVFDDLDAEDDDHIRQHILSVLNLSAPVQPSTSSVCKNPTYPPLCDMYPYVRFWRHKFNRSQVVCIILFYLSCSNTTTVGLFCIAVAGTRLQLERETGDVQIHGFHAG